MKHLVDLPLNDPSAWPLRMTKLEVAHVLRRSRRSLDDRIAQGRFPKPEDGTWAREVVERYVRGGIKEFERAAEKQLRRAGMSVVGASR